MSKDTEPPESAPLAPGQRVNLTIEDIAFGGEGVARHADFVVFVPFSLTGESVEAEIVEVKKRFARARLIRVRSPSADRVSPRCRYFTECGGCQYQHVRYERQLEIKQKQVRDLFERVGGFPGEVVAPIISCPDAYGYRNRIMVRSQYNKTEQRLLVGYLRGDSRLVVDVEECAIAEPALNAELAQVRANPPPRGGLKVVLRLTPEGWDVPRDSFFQNNFRLLPKLVQTARARLLDSKSRHLVDVYCGVGFFALELADLVESFVGIELDQPAIRAARRNAAARGRTNGEFVSGTAEEWLPCLLQRFPAHKTAVLLDPPRKGCAPSVIQLLRDVRPAQVLYVSCHPATLARDLNVLCRDGVFHLVNVTPLDMFPQTQHVECIADLRCRQPDMAAS
jgi:tRNA/tmRNA/rRNA uracil-C5-methylase (TrmA/RlmC/RlmD family)